MQIELRVYTGLEKYTGSRHGELIPVGIDGTMTIADILSRYQRVRLGSVPGLVACVQASEAVKYLLGQGELLVGRILVVDCLAMSFETVAVLRDPECPDCGSRFN